MEWKGMHVLIIGAARQGMGLSRYLVGQGARVTINDQRQPEALADVRDSLADLAIDWALGGHPLSLLDGVDMVCPSGGVPLTIPLVMEAVNRGIRLSNDSQIFLEEAPCKVIGITGSAGKTTTTTLVGRIAKAAMNAHSQKDDWSVWVGGNIGAPLIERVHEMKVDDLAVMELSSFQLELMTQSPQVAVVLNITPNHLDRHGSMQAYTAAKERVLDHQSDDDMAVLGRDDKGAWALAEQVAGRLYTFGLQELASGEMGTFVKEDSVWLQNQDGLREVIALESIQLRGEHNLQNVLAACAIAAAVDLPVQAMRAGIEGFSGVPHRLEFVRNWGGADWYNDSIATAPERAIAAMKSFDAPLALLAGGQDKDLPWDEFASEVRARVDHLVVFGEAADVILQAVGDISPGERPYTISNCEGLIQAAETAASLIEEGDVALLSPGGTSYDEFEDFEERGDKFRAWVQAL